jgi:hypothetical protein
MNQKTGVCSRFVTAKSITWQPISEAGILSDTNGDGTRLDRT